MNKKVVARLIKLQRVMAWMLIPVAAIAMVSGYGVTKRIWDASAMLDIHLWSVWFFIGLLVFHVLVAAFLIPFRWRYWLSKIRSRKAASRPWFKVLQRLSALAVLITAILMIISGLDWYNVGFGDALPLNQHLRYDIYLAISAVIHIAVSLKLAFMKRPALRKRMSAALVNVSVIAVALSVLFLATYVDSAPVSGGGGSPDEDTLPTEIAEVQVGDQEFIFDPTEVETIRPDLFNPGYFSMFDVLVHLDKRGDIALEYHFDDLMNTQVVDSISGEPDWWYEAYYDGGWSEGNMFRMDHYPWKNGTTLEFFKEKRSRLEDIYSTFREEVAILDDNGGNLVVPSVIVKGRNFTKEFENVEVTPHNMRSDMFREDVITALDVVMSLGDQGKIEYELQWYESVGTADIVKSYWVDFIDGDKSSGRCGFVYESGSLDFYHAGHIHIPPDIRAINSPEYVKYFWICI